MGKKKKANGKAKTTTPTVRKWSVRKATISVAALAVGLLIGVGVWKATNNQSQPESVTPVNEPADERPLNREEPPREVRAASPEFPKLLGKWERADGGYIVDIKNVDARGRLDAAYLNPHPIHVARAEAFHDGTATRVFIELRDVNYPGSTYELTYDPQSDQLTGVYFQAVQQQRFEVTFDRVK